MEVANLKSYLANINMTLKDFCEILDCSYKHMSMVAVGKKSASRRLAKDVREITNGLIELKTSPRPREKKKEQQQQPQEQLC